MAHLFVVTYENDAERKRIEYLIDKWSNRAKMSKIRGISFIVEAPDVSRFVEELLSKLDPPSDGKLMVYEVRPEDIGSKVTPKKAEIRKATDEDPKVVSKLLRYILTKFGAYYASSEGALSTYRAYTKKGRLEMAVSVEEEDGKTTVRVLIEGYGSAVEDMAKKIERELSLLL